MKNAVFVLGSLILFSCQAYEKDPLGAIRSQRDVDAYNASVTSQDQKLVCSKEKVIGTNFREFVCMTVAQQKSQQRNTGEYLENLGGGGAAGF